MNVYLAEGGGDQVPGEAITRWVLRSDLAPTPRTVELVIKMTGDLPARFQVGSVFWTGREMLKYEVVKVDRGEPAGVIQGSEPEQAMKVTALLESCAQIAYRRARAVIFQNTTLGALYRACGARISIGDDFNVRRFSCMRGQVPSFDLAVALQEECAALVLRNGRINAVRLADLFKQTPIDEVGQTDSSAAIASDFLERHEIPSYFSLAANGGFIMGAFETTRAVDFRPRSDERVLRNLSRVLVRRKVIDSTMCQEVIAGDLMRVGGERLVVMTAAHAYEQRDGTTDSKSRLWLGAMSK